MTTILIIASVWALLAIVSIPIWHAYITRNNSDNDP